MYRSWEQSEWLCAFRTELYIPKHLVSRNVPHKNKNKTCNVTLVQKSRSNERKEKVILRSSLRNLIRSVKAKLWGTTCNANYKTYPSAALTRNQKLLERHFELVESEYFQWKKFAFAEVFEERTFHKIIHHFFYGWITIIFRPNRKEMFEASDFSFMDGMLGCSLNGKQFKWNYV